MSVYIDTPTPAVGLDGETDPHAIHECCCRVHGTFHFGRNIPLTPGAGATGAEVIVGGLLMLLFAPLMFSAHNQATPRSMI
jgi:hypothetical protein